MIVLYFTATGNSLAVAKHIGGTLLSIPRLVKEERYELEDDVIGVVCPTYCADAPRMVRNYLERAKLKADFTFSVCTYGYQAGAATAHAAQYLTKASGHADYVTKIIMADTALTRFESQKQIDTLPEKYVEEQIAAVCEDIRTRKHGVAGVTLFDRAVDWLYHAAGAAQVAPDRTKDYTVDDRCVLCGSCAKLCPIDNIVVTDHVEFLGRCEGCLGCVHNCPKNAIHVKGERSSARFRNPEIKLKDLIAANR